VREGEVLEDGFDTDAAFLEERGKGRTVGELARVRRLGDDVVCGFRWRSARDRQQKEKRTERTFSDHCDELLDELLLLLLILVTDRAGELVEALRAGEFGSVEGVRKRVEIEVGFVALHPGVGELATVVLETRTSALVRRGESPVVGSEEGDVCVEGRQRNCE
jgi:hypothetical protein